MAKDITLAIKKVGNFLHRLEMRKSFKWGYLIYDINVPDRYLSKAMLVRVLNIEP